MKTIKSFFLSVCIGFTMHSYSQKTAEPTTAFTVSGKVKQERTFTLEDLLKLKSHELKNVNTSCSPKKEERIKVAKGVLLKQVFDSVAFDYAKGGELNAFYFVFMAADGYKLVYSYNEIFNTQTGNNLYVVTELNGQPITGQPNSLLVLTTSDIKGGRRNMKWLREIKVCLAE